MTSFDARLRLLSQPGFPLGVEVDLADERMVVTAGGSEIGDWALDEIRVFARSDGFHVQAEDEELILNVSDRASFASEIGLDLTGV
jgi:hypothetical protein